LRMSVGDEVMGLREGDKIIDLGTREGGCDHIIVDGVGGRGL
jgi:hypothetical protein